MYYDDLLTSILFHVFIFYIYIYKDKIASANLDCRSLKSLKNIQIYQNYQFSQKKEET
jgi:hypothetical protein